MQLPGITREKGIIAWFAANHVAANLLMLFIIVAGILSVFSIRKETQPEIDRNQVRVQVAYLGAGPEEVEEGVVIKIEEAIQSVDGIERIRSEAREGRGTVTVEIDIDTDIDVALNEIKIQVDAISTFPALTENPVISKIEITNPVVLVTIHGDIDAFMRKAIAQEVRDDLLQMPEVNDVQFFGDRPYEISIEVSEQTLRQYGLTMSEVSQAVRNSSVDLPGGSIKAEGGDILLRTEGQVYTGDEFGQLVLRTFADGTRLTLADIAVINDGFAETDGWGRFDGEPSASIRVSSGGNQNELETARVVNAYIEEKRKTLPPGVEMDPWVQISYYLEARLDMMTSNMVQGAILVFIFLSLFLRMKVAFWVIVGLPITFLGALWLMPFWPVSINTISLFGFIVVLGIVVDDAIIIGESIFTKIREDGHTLDNVIQGAHRVAIPATFGVLTTIAAFAPMMFLGGIVGPWFEAMGVVVILCLLFSLVESKLILPAHLVHAKIPPVDEEDLFNPQRKIRAVEIVPRFFLKIQRHIQHGLMRLIHDYYKPLLKKAVANRGVTATIFLAMLIITIGMMNSGIARVVLLPRLASDFVRAELQMQNGTAPEVRNAAAARMEQSLIKLNEDYVAEHPGELPMIEHFGMFTRGETSTITFVELPKDEDRPFSHTEVADLWREATGQIAGVKELTFSGAGHIGGPPLSLRLSGGNYESLERAAEELGEVLGEYEGIHDVRNSALAGGSEIKLTIKPEAEALGLTMVLLGRQVRQAFYGEEAQRIQRGKNEIKVMVRYPREERRSVADLENMRIRTPSGAEVPFLSVAEVSFGQGYSRISRLNRERTVTVSADIDPDIVQPQEVIADISENFIPGLLSRYPGVTFALEGSSQDQREFAFNAMLAFIVALFLIYALIAIPLHSYSQPLLIMSVIPFGVIGAVIGHVIMGLPISVFSLFGIIALTGVVVNDSLILVDFINKARIRGVPINEAVVSAGTLRFRAIILTSVTTAAGLTPIMLEGSVQAQSVIPTAVSLSFGIIFATVITLFLVPVLYVLQEDFFRWFRYWWDLLLGRPERDTLAETD